MNMCWVAVCNASRGRIFAVPGVGHPWQMVASLEHPQSRSKNMDLVTDKSGLSQHSGRYSSPLTTEPSPKKQEAEEFASEITQALLSGLQKHLCNRIVLVAPAHFLGLLRSQQDAHLKEKIVATVEHDFTLLSEQELFNRLHDSVVKVQHHLSHKD